MSVNELVKLLPSLSVMVTVTGIAVPEGQSAETTSCVPLIVTLPPAGNERRKAFVFSSLAYWLSDVTVTETSCRSSVPVLTSVADSGICTFDGMLSVL